MARWLVVGLGNPGPTYASNRHNVGAMVVDEVARRAGTPWKPHRMQKADLAEIKISSAGIGIPGTDASPVTLAKTRTYMNQSGVTVRSLLSSLKLRPDHLIVVHDEIDLDVGRLKMKFGGGDNGHNGLKSIRSMIGTGDFYRVRLGVGRSSRIPVEKWVLSNFPKDEVEDIRRVILTAADAVESLIVSGLDAAQQKYTL